LSDRHQERPSRDRDLPEGGGHPGVALVPDPVSEETGRNKEKRIQTGKSRSL
jgi:hypothetical protein